VSADSEFVEIVELGFTNRKPADSLAICSSYNPELRRAYHLGEIPFRVAAGVTFDQTRIDER
jgi:hypothetical protein